MLIRLLLRDEISLVWGIDRREYISNVFRLRDGELLLEVHDFDVPGWQPGQEESTGKVPLLRTGRAMVKPLS